jgi:lipopolysaccharide/colanic/teichoic acid biosynthesis glycosyltransferase
MRNTKCFWHHLLSNLKTWKNKSNNINKSAKINEVFTISSWTISKNRSKLIRKALDIFIHMMNLLVFLVASFQTKSLFKLITKVLLWLTQWKLSVKCQNSWYRKSFFQKEVATRSASPTKVLPISQSPTRSVQTKMKNNKDWLKPIWLRC